MKNNNEFWSKWLPFFIISVLLIFIYKTLDNFDLVILAFNKFLKIISPFLFGVLICYFLYNPCLKIEKIYTNLQIKFIAKKARFYSVITVYLILLLIITLFIMFVIPILINSLVDLASNLSSYYNHILEYINKLPADFNKLNIKANLNEFASNTLSEIFDPTKIQQLTKSIIGLANGILNFFISLIISLYILLDRDNIFDFFNKLSLTIFKEKTRKQAKKYLNEINRVIFTFIASKGLDSIINAVVITTILVVLNVKYALLLGLIGGLANFIPYLGSLIAVIFISLLTLLTGGPNLALEALIFLIIFQQIDGNFIEPKIMGNNLKISPILVIFSVIVGGAYFGITGMFFAVPITTILKQILLEYIDSHKHEDNKPKSIKT